MLENVIDWIEKQECCTSCIPSLIISQLSFLRKTVECCWNATLLFWKLNCLVRLYILTIMSLKKTIHINSPNKSTTYCKLIVTDFCCCTIPWNQFPFVLKTSLNNKKTWHVIVLSVASKYNNSSTTLVVHWKELQYFHFTRFVNNLWCLKTKECFVFNYRVSESKDLMNH